ncbi:MAG TPA: hypothetical protein VGI45_14965 [Terracidiphilus sp.]
MAHSKLNLQSELNQAAIAIGAIELAEAAAFNSIARRSIVCVVDTVVLWQVKFTNNGATPRTLSIAVTADPGWMPANAEILGPGEIRARSDKWKMDAVYRFFDLPQGRADGQFAEWQVLSAWWSTLW